MQDSINALWLEGWDDKSVWGYDTGTESYFAQLTRNGNSDDDGPDIWITPSRTQPPITDVKDLWILIVRATGAGPMVVWKAMSTA